MIEAKTCVYYLLGAILKSYLAWKKYQLKVSYSMKGKLVIYLLAAVVISFLLFMQYYQNKRHNEAEIRGAKIRVLITKVSCNNGRLKSSLYFRNRRNEVKHVNVSYVVCKQHKEGDTVIVFANEANDWYEIDLNNIKVSH